MPRYANFVLLVLLLGAAGLFFIKNPDGQIGLSVAAFIPNTAMLTARFNAWRYSAERYFTRSIDSRTHDGKTKVYKWRDNAGHWHVSDQPINAAGGLDEMIHVNPDTNLIQSTY